MMMSMRNIYHTHPLSPNQCGSNLTQTIDAPLPLVWSLVRQFDQPQAYKRFVKTSQLSSGEGRAGSVRELTMVSGFPGARSTERLDRLDDDLHLMVFSVVGGEQKLVNYQSTTTLHQDDETRDGGKTVVMESYVVDIPADSCKEDTCLFVNTVIGLDLKSLANVTEKRARES